MADEVIIEEYASFDAHIQAPTVWITTQILDIGTLSAKLNDKTEYIMIQAREAGWWYTFGGSSASAAAETNGSSYRPVGTEKTHKVGKGSGLYIDTAADA